MDRVSVAVGAAALILVYTVYRRYTSISLGDVPGPESASFIMGNTKELYQGQVGDADFKWQAQYGNVVRFKGTFGEDQLLISDPAAMQYIFAKSNSQFPKQHERLVLSQMVIGKSVAWASGDDHKRQRKVVLPAFGAPESKAFLSLFRGCAESMSNKWMDVIINSKEQSVVLNIPEWMSRAALDAIGEAAFDVHFGSIDNNESALARSYSGMLNDALGAPSAGQIFFQGISRYIPYRILEYLGETSKNPRILRIREAETLATSFAKQMVKDKAEILLQGKSSRDVFSLLVKANMDTDAKAKLTEEELIAQMRGILFTGHETSANTISWGLFQLARNPDIQSRLRAEIRETEAVIHARGDVQYTIADFDNMPYTTAVMKEVLRFCPVVYHVYRTASEDDVLPLSQPITTRLGDIIHELPVPKGTRLVVSIAACNRNKDLWGEDAHVFNPERWLNGAVKEKKTTSSGVYSNLMTFGGGARACIGWRFALIEFQAFLTEVVGKFEFTLTDRCERVRRETCLVMAPTLEGEIESGVQLPLRVSVAPVTEKEY
ncbi:cytochrome P450 [Rhizopogon salebrosus TDB-379]|nr:cytochrome P450 [Rhizopogon salebrosus TDB-379]